MIFGGFLNEIFPDFIIACLQFIYLLFIVYKMFVKGYRMWKKEA